MDITQDGDVTRVTFKNGTQLAWDTVTGRAIIKHGGKTLETITSEEWKRIRQTIGKEVKMNDKPQDERRKALEPIYRFAEMHGMTVHTVTLEEEAEAYREEQTQEEEK